VRAGDGGRRERFAICCLPPGHVLAISAGIAYFIIARDIGWCVSDVADLKGRAEAHWIIGNSGCCGGRRRLLKAFVALPVKAAAR